MYDILVYLFENYQHPTTFPENKALIRKLSAVGFENAEIREALAWLAEVNQTLEQTAELDFHCLEAFRLFDDKESRQLDILCRNFLYFLETAGVIDARSRELIIQLAMELKDRPLTFEHFKVVTLFALWSGDEISNALVLEELLSDESTMLH